MNNSTLNSLRKQLTFDFTLNFNVKLDSEEVALMTLFENLDYSAFGKALGRHEKISADKMMILLVHGAVNNKTSSRDLEKLVNRDLFMKAVFGPEVKVDHSTISRFIKKYPKEIEDVFYQSVKQLDKLGELGKKVVFQDGTKIESRANRSIQVEGRFAEIKQQLGLRRFSSFGKTRVFTEWLLACMASNVVQLAARIEQEKVGIPFWYKIEKEKIA